MSRGQKPAGKCHLFCRRRAVGEDPPQAGLPLRSRCAEQAFGGLILFSTSEQEQEAAHDGESGARFGYCTLHLRPAEFFQKKPALPSVSPPSTAPKLVVSGGGRRGQLCFLPFLHLIML